MKTAPQQKRDHALKQARDAMLKRAETGETLTYDDISKEITVQHYQPNSSGLSALLCDISEKEFKRRERLLSVVVVRQDSGIPGDGFFELAERLGLDVSDRPAFFQEELASVHDSWASAG